MATEDEPGVQCKIGSESLVRKFQGQLLAHPLESFPGTGHFPTFVIVLLNFSIGESEFLGDITNVLVDDMDVGYCHKSLGIERSCFLHAGTRLPIIKKGQTRRIWKRGTYPVLILFAFEISRSVSDTFLLGAQVGGSALPILTIHSVPSSSISSSFVVLPIVE